MLSVNDLRNGTLFEWEDAPWKVSKFEHTFKGRGRGKVTVRAKNLKNGSVREISFQSSESVGEADVVKKKLTFLYRTREEAVFDPPAGEAGGEEQLFIPIETIEWELNFLTKRQEVWVLFYNEQPIGLILPPTVSLMVKKSDPGAKGDTVSNVLKPAMLETGFETKVPLFIDEGERVIIDTENGEYRGRA